MSVLGDGSLLGRDHLGQWHLLHLTYHSGGRRSAVPCDPGPADTSVFKLRSGRPRAMGADQLRIVGCLRRDHLHLDPREIEESVPQGLRYQQANLSR